MADTTTPKPGGATAGGLPVPLTDPKHDPGREAEQLPTGQKKATKAKHKTGDAPPSRFSLRMTANWWRSLQYIGMSLHFLAPPQPPSPAFSRTVTSTLSAKKGSFTMQFYTPEGYRLGDDPGKRHGHGSKCAKTSSAADSKRYPVVVNFHGGGFTIGAATDDARFARFVTETCDALFVSVDYRLAPEYPFPTAVDDAADALLYLVRNAAVFRVDPFRLATSGFSAGGNLALTAPLRLRRHLASLPAGAEACPEHRIVAVATWYPLTDYSLTRAERRAQCIRPDQAIPSTLTDLFDASYLFPPDLDLADPTLSPSRAPDDVLADGLPRHVLFYTCEWDMLLREGEELARRLAAPPIAKDVRYRMIRGVPHGWDKHPSPLRPPEQSEGLYRECCEALREIFLAE